jgi:N-acetylneuraminate lyase
MPGVLTGLIPACHTPFHPDGQLNLAMVQHQAALFRESGLRSVFVGGTTGEFASLTLKERQALCDRWVEVAGDSLRIAVHAGHNCQADAIELAAHARGAGVAAVAAMAPSFFKPASVHELIDFLIPIAAQADPLPFYYYHIPCMTGVRLCVGEFLHEARFRIPNLRGLKYSHDDLVDLQKCVAADGGVFGVLFGFDEALLAGLSLGACGAVGSTYNFAAPHYLRLIRAFEAGELATARKAQLQAAQLVTTLAGFGFAAASKAVMRLIGVDCGPVRPPLSNLSSGQASALAEVLARCGMLARPIMPMARAVG